MYNTEKIFDYLIDIGDEKSYIKYLSQWFIRSKYDLNFKVMYYYQNMYRKFTSYKRFEHISEAEPTYKEMECIGKKFIDRYYDKYFKYTNKKVNNDDTIQKSILIIINGLDFKQSIAQFLINLAASSENKNLGYHIVSVLTEEEFRNKDETIKFLIKHNIEYYLPKSQNINERIEEFYEYIKKISPDYVIFQSFYFSPISILIYPLLKKMGVCIGRWQTQQPEDYFDKKIDFVITESSQAFGNECINKFSLKWPIDSKLIDKCNNIREYFNIDKNQIILVSIGREIKYRSKIFWEYIVKILEDIDNSVFVIFGCYYKHFKHLVPKHLVECKKIIFGGVDYKALSYLKACDYYINSFPELGGGLSLISAYYSELPIVSFYQKNNIGKYVFGKELAYIPLEGLFNTPEKIFPQPCNVNELILFTKKIIKDCDFKNYIQSLRKIDKEQLTFRYYTKMFESYLINLKEGKNRENN